MSKGSDSYLPQLYRPDVSWLSLARRETLCSPHQGSRYKLSHYQVPQDLHSRERRETS